MRALILLSASWAAITVDHAVAAQGPATPAPVQVRSQAESTAAFISRRRATQAQVNGRIGDQANLRELNGLVRAVNLVLPSPSFVTDQNQLAAIRESFLIDIAQNLALLGFKAGDLRGDQAAGARLVQAVAAKIRGTASIEDEARLADLIIIGTVRATRNEDRGDGFHSTIEVTADQVPRGATRSGEIVAVRRISGPVGQGTSLKVTSEDSIPTGARVALVGSNAFYLNAHGVTGARCSNCAVELIPMFLISGGVLVPTGGYSRSAPVSALSSAVQ